LSDEPVQPFDIGLFERAETIVGRCEMCDHQTHHDLLYRASQFRVTQGLMHGRGYIESKDAWSVRPFLRSSRDRVSKNATHGPPEVLDHTWVLRVEIAECELPPGLAPVLRV
jgi:hypothetical protein